MEHSAFKDQDQPQQPEEYGEVGELRECHTCGRKFNPQTLVKHSKVCEKVFVKKRKAFNMAEQRKATDASGKGVDVDPYAAKMAARNKKPEPVKKAGGIPKWKMQSMQLRQVTGANKTDAPSGGGNYGGGGGYGGGGSSNFNPS